MSEMSNKPKHSIRLTNANIQQLRGDLGHVERLEKTIAHWTGEVASCEEQVSALQAQIAHVETKVAERQPAVKAAEAARAACEAAPPEDTAELNELTRLLEEAKARVNEVYARTGRSLSGEAERTDATRHKRLLENTLYDKRKAIESAARERVAAVEKAHPALQEVSNAQYELNGYWERGGLRGKLGEVEKRLKYERDERARHVNDLAETKAKLNKAFPGVPENILRDIAQMKRPPEQPDPGIWGRLEEGSDPPEFEGWKTRDWAAYIRGEINVRCDCFNGRLFDEYEHASHDLVVRLYRDEIEHWGCRFRAHFDHAVFQRVIAQNDLVPTRYRHHRLRAMQPWPHSKITVSAQERFLVAVPSDFEGIDGWFLTGPGGSSKTTWVCASIIDVVTFRVADYLQHPDREHDHDEADRDDDDEAAPDLSVWRISVPEFIEHMDDWVWRERKRRKETRDDDDEWGPGYGPSTRRDQEPSPLPPLSPQAIRASSQKTGFRPILVLEEIHLTTNLTQNRRAHLHKLIDSVYAADGLIITATNYTIDRLTALVDGEDEDAEHPIVRRLTGENDPPETFLRWDLHKYKKQQARRTGGKTATYGKA
jgi:hypothetical protein